MTRRTWQDHAEWSCKTIAAFVGSFVGVTLLDRLALGTLAEALFWPPYVIWCYWLVIRDIHFSRPQVAAPQVASVQVTFELADGKFGSKAERSRIHRFTDKLDEALTKSKVGHFDGDEFGEGKCTLFMYGQDPEAIYRVIEPFVREQQFLRGATVELFTPGQTQAARTEVGV